MSWLRIDDSFADHPKLISLGNVGARWAFLELLIYCAKHGTDGYFPPTIGDTHRRLTPAFVERCIAVGLVDVDEESGEHRVHDWSTFNPGKDPTGSVRQQRWRNAQRNGSVTQDVTVPITANVTGDITASRARLPSPKNTSRSTEGSDLPVSENPGLSTEVHYDEQGQGFHDREVQDLVSASLATAATEKARA